MAKDTIIRHAEIVYTDKNTCIIEWSGNPGFGQLTFKHGKGCNITVDAECMDIDTIIKIMKKL